jgi:thioredoxin 1
MNNMIELTESGFEAEVLRANLPVVVDFYAPWCGPCKMLAPLLERFAAEFQGRIKFAKANVDDVPGPAGRYQVTGVPTLALFVNGEPADTLVGLASPKALRAWLQSAVSVTPQRSTTSAI